MRLCGENVQLIRQTEGLRVLFGGLIKTLLTSLLPA